MSSNSPETAQAAAQFRDLVTTLKGYKYRVPGILQIVRRNVQTEPYGFNYFGIGREFEQDGLQFGMYLRGAITPVGQQETDQEQSTYHLLVDFDMTPDAFLHRLHGISLEVRKNNRFSVGKCNLPEASQVNHRSLLAPLGEWATNAVLSEEAVVAPLRGTDDLPPFTQFDATPADLAPLQKLVEDPANARTYFQFHGDALGQADGVVLAQRICK